MARKKQINVSDLVDQFAARKQAPMNNDLKMQPEELLELVTSDQPDMEVYQQLVPLIRNMELRIEFFLNTPMKSILNIPLDHPDLREETEALMLKIMDIVRGAAADAMIKTVVENHPGG